MMTLSSLWRGLASRSAGMDLLAFNPDATSPGGKIAVACPFEAALA